MILTIIDDENNRLTTVRIVESVEVDHDDDGNCSIIINGKYRVTSKSEYRMIELFKHTSTMLKNDLHYMIFKDETGEYTIGQFNPEKIR